MKQTEISRRKFVASSAAISALGALSSITSSFSNGEEAGDTHIECDVLVYGATPAGIAAAVTAARQGRYVILAHYEDHIGGIIVNGLTNTDLDRGHRKAVGGFFNEFSDRILAHYRSLGNDDTDIEVIKACRDGFAYEPLVAELVFNQLVAEQGSRLRVLLRHELKQAICHGNKLTEQCFSISTQPSTNLKLSRRF